MNPFNPDITPQAKYRVEVIRHGKLQNAVLELLDFIYEKYGDGCPKKEFVWTCEHHSALAKMVRWPR
ncbi:MAG: hypothetical protein GY906_28445 [bacterium]|nr:hypothetical protein [bacterium]